jgi:kynurenine formamidase
MRLMRVIDLTLPLDSGFPPYVDAEGFQDPQFAAIPWATLEQQGYRVHRLEMGTHTGTHFDAPAHFHAEGKTVDAIPARSLVGPAVVIDVRRWGRVAAASLTPYAARVTDGGLPLFLADEEGVLLTTAAVSTICAWRPELILYAGQFVDEGERFHHNRVWLGAGIPLVTDLDAVAAATVRDGDVIVVAPLRLVGMDGSPCRVLALRFDPEEMG